MSCSNQLPSPIFNSKFDWHHPKKTIILPHENDRPILMSFVIVGVSSHQATLVQISEYHRFLKDVNNHYNSYFSNPLMYFGLLFIDDMRDSIYAQYLIFSYLAYLSIYLFIDHFHFHPIHK